MMEEKKAKEDVGGAGTQVERRFGWWDMFVAPEDDPRSEERCYGERETLLSFLRDYRHTIRLKCSGLDAEGMARRSVEPSNLTLLGLVRHLADVERFWFRRVMAGRDAPPRYRRDDDREAVFNDVAPDQEMVDDAWSAWAEEVQFAEDYVDEAPNLGVTGQINDDRFISLREVLVHMIEEYARHCGHADLIRERIDGRVGQ
jgi:uncharacterized damage-inducible protein DinB